MAFNVSMVAYEPHYIYIVRGILLDQMINDFQCFNGRFWIPLHLYCPRHIRSDDQWLSMFQWSLLNTSTFILSAAFEIGWSMAFNVSMIAFEPQYIYIVRGILDRMINGFQCFNDRFWAPIHLYCPRHIRSDDQWLSMFQWSLLNPSTFILSAAYWIRWSMAFNVSMVAFEH